MEYRTNKLQHSLKNQGVKIWNDLPMDTQNLPKMQFKRNLKLHLLQFYEKTGKS